MLARGLKSITKASSSTGKRIDMQKYVSDCLGVTPGMRISNAKSDESMGITGLVVPRHSLENDLVGSLNLLKTESGLRKPRQLPWATRTRSSRLRARPAMATPLGPRAERTGQRRGRRGRYFMPDAAGVLRRPHAGCRRERRGDDGARAAGRRTPRAGGAAVRCARGRPPGSRAARLAALALRG